MTHPLEGKFEPEARDARDPLGAASISIAVSLKRIADAMSGPDAGHAFSQNIYHALSTALIEDLHRRG